MSYRADKLVIDGHTDTHTHTQATTIPEGQNWPRVKTIWKKWTKTSKIQILIQFIVSKDPLKK